MWFVGIVEDAENRPPEPPLSPAEVEAGLSGAGELECVVAEPQCVEGDRYTGIGEVLITLRVRMQSGVARYPWRLTDGDPVASVDTQSSVARPGVASPQLDRDLGADGHGEIVDPYDVDRVR